MKRKIKMILIIIAILGSWIFLFQGINLAEAKDPDYPTKPITFYIPFGAGGTTDAVTRSLIEAVGKYLGQPFIPINKPGGGGSLGAVAVMNAKSDGNTLGAFAGTQIIFLPNMEECPYKDLSGFTLILNYVRYVLPAIVRGDSPYKTWKEFIEWARQNPRAAKIALSSNRSGCTQGLAMWQIEQKEGVECTYLPMKGTAEALSATLGGHITLNLTGLTPPVISHIKEGKLRILAYVNEEKIPGYEDIPSFQKLYGIVAPSYMGVWGPKGLPNYVLEKLDDAFAKGVKDPMFIDSMKKMYMPIVYLNRTEVTKEVKEVFPKIGEMFKILRAEEAKEKK